MLNLNAFVAGVFGTRAVRRRRLAAGGDHLQVGQAVDMLEIRVVPAPLHVGLYLEDGIEPTQVGDRVNVLTDNTKLQNGRFIFGSTSQSEIVVFDVQIVAKNNGSVRIKSADDEVHGKATLKKQDAQFEYSFKYKFKINGEVFAKTGSISGPIA